MKFLTILSAIVCVLSIGVTASPAPVPGSSSKTDETKKTEAERAYDKIIAVHPGAVPGKRYAFTMKWPPKTDGDQRTIRLHAELGCGHIALMVGSVTVSPPSKWTGEKKTFAGQVYHMMGTDTTVYKDPAYYPSSLTLTYLKETKKTHQQIKLSVSRMDLMNDNFSMANTIQDWNTLLLIRNTITMTTIVIPLSKI